MSDTPRTDAEAGFLDEGEYWRSHETGFYVDADFARELERENTSLRCLAIEQQKAIKRLLCTMKAARHVEGQLKDENATLRKDKERLDWLEECHAWPDYIDAEWHCKGQVFSSLRDAIDAARKEDKP